MANYALSLIASFLSRLSLGKVAKFDRSRRYPKAFGIEALESHQICERKERDGLTVDRRPENLISEMA
jgi:hypothetical protein